MIKIYIYCFCVIFMIINFSIVFLIEYFQSIYKSILFKYFLYLIYFYAYVITMYEVFFRLKYVHLNSERLKNERQTIIT